MNTGHEAGQSEATPNCLSASTAGLQPSNGKETWTCFKCRHSNQRTEKSCSNCTNLAQGKAAELAASNQAYSAGFEGGSVDPQGAANQAANLQETWTVDIQVQVVLTKEGWQCEGCRALTSLYYTYCCQCNEPNSIGKALILGRR